MTTFIFSTKRELIKQARKDEACGEGLAWAKKMPSLKKILKEIPFEYRLWCLEQGYMQFKENCEWEKLEGNDWSFLLSMQPQFLSFFCFPYQEKLDGKHWVSLLLLQPHFCSFCDWKKFKANDWAYLLTFKPEFSKFKN